MVTHTITTGIEVDDTANTDVDHTEEALVLLLELLLVEYLDRQHAILGNSPARDISILSNVPLASLGP